jgi:dihydroorotase
MTLYLTDNTTPEMIEEAKASGIIFAVKYYPAGATTNSDSGVTDLEKVYPALEKMSELGIPLLLHGEVTNTMVEVFDLERVFVERVLAGLVERFPDLKIVLEHITTYEAVEFVCGASDNVAATVTPQHLIMTSSDLFRDKNGKMGCYPHNFCLPILKHRRDQIAIEAAVTGAHMGDQHKRFFAGTDSAPHVTATKETSCGCAGCFCEPAAIAAYTMWFEKMSGRGWEERLEQFLSIRGAEFYGLPQNQEKITLVKESWKVPDSIQVVKQMVPRYTPEQTHVTPWLAGEILEWQVED